MPERLPSDQSARETVRSVHAGATAVEAGAGTGKTRSMVERITDIVASGDAELREIAAITFTEAAAAELRDRVRAELERLARGENERYAAESAERCAAALGQVDDAAISTIHAFAGAILAESPLDAGLPPRFEVIDEVMSVVEFGDAWRAFENDLFSDDAKRDVLLWGFALGLGASNIETLARAFRAEWDRLIGWEPAALPGPASPAEVVLDLTGLELALTDVVACVDWCIAPDDRLLEHLIGLQVYLEEVREAPDDIARIALLAGGPKLASSAGTKGNWLHGGKDAVVERLQAAEEARDALLAEVRTAVLKPVLGWVRSFALEVAGARRAAGRIDFHDLLVLARDLLAVDEDARARVGSRVKYLLIDEFQDTDPLQVEIALLVASGRSLEGGTWSELLAAGDGNLFVVGDPKQSIYRFRRADVAVYEKLVSNIAGGPLQLVENFRSTPEIIRWVNALFTRLMDGDDEGQARHVDLLAHRTSDRSWMRPVGVIGGVAGENMGECRQAEARALAEAVRAVKAGRWQVSDRARGPGGTRDACYRDIAILLPTRTSLRALEAALESADIPYRIESASLVLQTPEVREILAMLTALDDPTDEISVVATLRSPAFACSDSDLLRWKLAGGEWSYLLPAPSSIDAGDPVATAMGILAAYHHRLDWEPAPAVLESLVAERGVLELAFVHRRPRDRWRRVRFILDQLRRFFTSGGVSLREFLAWIQIQIDEASQFKEMPVPEDDDDAVRVMTIHGAKGLEFPVVFLTGLNRAARGSAQPGAAVFWAAGAPGEVVPSSGPEVRLGSKSQRVQTPRFDEVATGEAELDRAEEIRLLYVAMTRARDHLVLSLFHPPKGSSHAKTIYELLPQLEGACVRLDDELGVSAAQARVAEEPEAPLLPDVEAEAAGRSAWIERRESAVDRLRKEPVRAATELALMVAGDSIPKPWELHLAPGARVGAGRGDDTKGGAGRATRAGVMGRSVGSAVHEVLRRADLGGGDDVRQHSVAAAEEQGIPELAEQVEGLARLGLEAPVVRQAVARRHWREVYVGSEVGGRLVEGIIDLLFETDDGLVVVDYKTDAATLETELDAALAFYEHQGAAYALALEGALGRKVSRCVFLFLTSGGAVESDVPDLAGAMERVRAALEEVPV